MNTGFLEQWKRRIAFVPVRVARWLGDSRAAFAVPVVVLLALLGATIRDPRFAARPVTVDLNLPSEVAIPQPIPARAIDAGDPVWRFRYAATGTEARAGIPYWIFRVMPRLFPDVFRGRGYDHFGFDSDDQQYYWSRAGGSRETRRRCAQTENAFVQDVLGDPVLHAREVKLQYQDDPERLAALIEYLHASDLVEIATGSARRAVEAAAQAGVALSAPSGVEAGPAAAAVAAVAAAAAAAAGGEFRASPRLLPARWVGEAAVRDPATSYATVENFRAYVERWFSTIEGTAAQQFKARIRRLTLVLSCLLAVVFNFDGIHLIQSLYASDSGRAELQRQTAELRTVATRLGVSGAPDPTGAPVDRRDSANSDLGLELQKTAAILDETRIGLGWRESWIADRWCRWHPQCLTSAPRSTLGQVLLDTLLWLAGIAFGCAMLALGAPFWVTTLSRLINMRNEVQARRESGDREGPPPTAAPPPDATGAPPALNGARQY